MSNFISPLETCGICKHTLLRHWHDHLEVNGVRSSLCVYPGCICPGFHPRVKFDVYCDALEAQAIERTEQVTPGVCPHCGTEMAEAEVANGNAGMKWVTYCPAYAEHDEFPKRVS